MHFAPGSAGFVFSSGVSVNGKWRRLIASFYFIIIGKAMYLHVFGLKFLAVRTNLLCIF